MALDFDKLKPEAKKAAFAHMDRARGVGSFKKKGSGAITGRLFDKPKTTRGSSSLGSGTRHKKLTAGQKSGIKATPKSTSKATADTPEARFDSHVTSKVQELTKRGNSYAGLVDLRKGLDAQGMSRADQDKHLKRMSREGKIHIVPEDNRKALRQEDHDTAIHIGGEPNHLVSLAEDRNHPNAAPRTSSQTPLQSTDPVKAAQMRTPEDHADLAQKFLQMHGDAGVAHRISMLEKRKRLGPGERAQLAALKSLGKGDSSETSPKLGSAPTESERAKLQAFVAKRQAQAAASPDDRYTAGAKKDAETMAEADLKRYGGRDGVARRISRLEGRKNLAPGERAQLAMLRSLLRKK